MRQWLTIAALAATLLVSPVWAQRHGGISAGAAGRSGFASRGPSISSHGFVGSGNLGLRAPGFGAPRFGAHFGTTFGPPFRRPFVSSNRFYPRRFYGYPWSYGYVGAYYVDPGFYSDYAYPSADTAYSGYNPSAGYFDPNTQYQQSEVDRLENEVAQLREERAARTNAAANPEPQPVTTLVFQDKHTEEVHNYAIVGETLWIFNEEHARKVPLTDLDIPATQKTNEDHGVDFRLPG